MNNKDYSNLSQEEQLCLVKQNGWAIEYIKNPSQEVQIEAVKQNGYAIKYIKNPSLEVQLEAVKQNGFAIEFIKNPNLEMQLIAITGKWAKEIIPNINSFIPNQHPQLLKEYIKWVKGKINGE